MNLFLIRPDGADRARLDADEAKHCLKVLRHRPGDEIHGIDGEGTYFRARITGTAGQEALLEIVEAVEGWGEHGQRVVLGISPLHARDRFEWAMEKAVELGVTDIFPLECARTSRQNLRYDRLNGILLSALKQCKRSALPVLHPLAPVAEVVAQLQAIPVRMLAWCERGTPVGQSLVPAQDSALLIGPEGDFTPQEALAAEQAGFSLVSLGETRLRTETAAIYGLSAMKFVRESGK